jgi:2-keto-4-pentenoate hydratase/2-oxohepta-3-ene-1,7-dioic acid hydratase in catechol pathway
MRFVRFQYRTESPRFGWVYEDKVGAIEGNIFGDFRRLEATLPLEEVRLFAPVSPSKIVCLGRNYAEHAREHQAEVPEYPLIFLKPPTTVIGPGDTIRLPPQSKQVEHEAELAIVIGKQGRWIASENAADFILGYTIANDVTARDLQRKDGQWTRGKGFDTFCPLGPWIDSEFQPVDHMITCRVNDVMRQMGSTRDMIFQVPQIITFISSIMTLHPGDILLTGTPAGVGPLVSGDIVEVKIDGLGALRNSVSKETEPVA